jgi:hypothetical protein
VAGSAASDAPNVDCEQDTPRPSPFRTLEARREADLDQPIFAIELLPAISIASARSFASIRKNPFPVERLTIYALPISRSTSTSVVLVHLPRLAPRRIKLCRRRQQVTTGDRSAALVNISAENRVPMSAVLFAKCVKTDQLEHGFRFKISS